LPKVKNNAGSHKAMPDNQLWVQKRLRLEHRAKKWIPVFRKNDATSKNLERRAFPQERPAL
jgi:hypothetical protein